MHNVLNGVDIFKDLVHDSQGKEWMNWAECMAIIWLWVENDCLHSQFVLDMTLEVLQCE